MPQIIKYKNLKDKYCYCYNNPADKNWINIEMSFNTVWHTRLKQFPFNVDSMPVNLEMTLFQCYMPTAKAYIQDTHKNNFGNKRSVSLAKHFI